MEKSGPHENLEEVKNMKTEFMNQESIIALLKSQGLEPMTKQDTSRLMISKKVIRYEMGDTMIVGMGSDKKKDDQIHLVVDASVPITKNRTIASQLIIARPEQPAARCGNQAEAVLSGPAVSFVPNRRTPKPVRRSLNGGNDVGIG